MPVFQQRLQADQEFFCQLRTPAGLVALRIVPYGQYPDLKLHLITPPGLQVETLDTPRSILPFSYEPLPPDTPPRPDRPQAG